MKKIYTTLALAAVVGVNAVAAGLPAKNSVSVANVGETVEIKMAESTKKSAPAKELNYTTADEIAGYYILHCNSGFGEGDFDFTLEVTKGEAADEVIVYGFWNNCQGVTAGALGVKGQVVKSGDNTTIVFKQQTIGKFSDGTDIVFYPFDPFQGGGIVENMTMTVCPTGVQYNDGTTAYEEGCLAVLSRNNFFISNPAIVGDSRGYALLYNIILCPLELYGTDAQQMVNINESEWKSLGTGSFEEGYVYPLVDGNKKAGYDVEVFQKSDNSNVFLVKQPYGSATPFATANATPDAAGYIYIDATTADCVAVRPMVYSGFDDQENWEGKLFLANEEGVQYFLDESSIDDIKEYFDYYELPMSSMKVEGEKVTINILNGCLANVCDLFTYAPFTNAEGAPIPCESVLTFKAGAGVEGVINDAENAPKRFFNLQGMEVVNPAAGELVIVKQGNKATKTIVK